MAEDSKKITRRTIAVFTFGHDFKVPTCDLVFDIRKIKPNAATRDISKRTDGRNKDYQKAFFADEYVEEKFADLRLKVIDFLKDRKSDVSIAIGCAEGRHRSVAFAERLVAELGTKPELSDSKIQLDHLHLVADSDGNKAVSSRKKDQTRKSQRKDKSKRQSAADDD